MKIKKLGHCCLLIEYGNDFRILTDPGGFTIEAQKELKDIDMVLITHEHGDHLHTESLQEIIKNNDQVKIVANSSVGKILDDLEIKYDLINNGDSKDWAGIFIDAFEVKHKEIYGETGRVQNTGYMIDKRFFYPGDAFINPEREVEILALPVAGPWMSVKEAIDYLKEIKPKYCFPVHDAVLSKGGKGVHFGWIERTLDEGTEFIPLEEGQDYNFNN